jgi:hypothetical protein
VLDAAAPLGGRSPSRCAERAGHDHDPGAAPSAWGTRCPVPPLGLPPAGGGEPLSQLRQNEAVLLFTERAVAASGSFELTSSNQAAVVGLCRRLDGLPLAIELAAVRTRVLTAEQILDRLTDRSLLLTGGGGRPCPVNKHSPGSRTTVGLPEPVPCRCIRCPPTSTSCPGIG